MPEEHRVPFDVDRYVQAVTTSPDCFVCRTIRGPDSGHPLVYRDDRHIAFLARWPALRGHTLVAPLAHREQVVGDFDVSDYLALQAVVHRVGRAITAVLPTERLYVLSLGSQQGNRHVHWHVAPLPPGTPYEEQQFAALMLERRGYVDIPPAERAELAATIGRAMPEA